MVELKQGDCLELLKNIPDGSVDMVLCDLPYGMTANPWDAVIPLPDLWREYRRIAKDRAPIVLHCQQPFTAALIESNRRDYKYCWYWDKHLKTNFLNAYKQPLRQVEEIAVFYRKQCPYHPPKKKGKNHMRNKPENILSNNYGDQKSRVTTISDEYFPSNLLQEFPKEVFKGGHPTAKPVPLLEYLIKTYTEPGDTVLDNCMGSGSTGVAAINTGRSFVGMELDPEYYAMARQRICDAENAAMARKIETSKSTGTAG